MSYVSSLSSSASLYATVATTTSNSLRPFANLDLTEDQRTQIRSIFSRAKSQGLSQSQLQQAINAVLTPAQQQTLQSDIQQQSQSQSAQSAITNESQPEPGEPSNDPTANLSLTDSQKSQIDQILQAAQAGTITQQQALAQITSVLTPAQQTALQQDEQTAQTSVSGHHHHHHGGGTSSTSSNTSTSTATLPSGVTEADIQNQVAAATSVILNNLQADVTSSN